MGHTSRSSSATVLRAPQSDAAYTRLAEMAAREAEINCNEAAQRRAWLEAAPARKVNHSISVRLAEPPRSVPLPAEQASEPEFNQHEATRMFTERDASPVRRAEDDFIDARLKELEERERALADREKLIAMLEALLDQSRRRLEELLEQLEERRAALTPTARVEAVRPSAVAIGYVGSGSYPKRNRLVDDPARQELRVAGDLTASTA